MPATSRSRPAKASLLVGEYRHETHGSSGCGCAGGNAGGRTERASAGEEKSVQTMRRQNPGLVYKKWKKEVQMQMKDLIERVRAVLRAIEGLW